MKARGWTNSHPDVIAAQREVEALRKSGGGANGSGEIITPLKRPSLGTRQPSSGGMNRPASAIPERLSTSGTASPSGQRPSSWPASAAPSPRDGGRSIKVVDGATELV